MATMCNRYAPARINPVLRFRQKKKTPGPGVNGQERFYLRPICNRGNFCHFSPVLCDNFVDNKGPAMVNPAYFRGFIGLI